MIILTFLPIIVILSCVFIFRFYKAQQQAKLRGEYKGSSLLNVIKKAFCAFFEVWLWLFLIVCTILGGVLGRVGGNPIPGILIGLIVGMLINIIFGGCVATIISIDKNINTLKHNSVSGSSSSLGSKGMLNFVKNIFSAFFVVWVWIFLIGCTILGGVLGSVISETFAFICAILGLIIGLLLNIVVGGCVATIISIDEDVEGMNKPEQ